jgi:type II secretory pathway pseudopilin PulG
MKKDYLGITTVWNLTKKAINIACPTKGNFVSKNKKNGFTILEALMGLMIMGVLAVLILQMVLLMSKSTGDLLNQRQTILYVVQLQRDLIATEHISIVNEQVKLEKHNEEIIYYGKRGNKLIRSNTIYLIGGDVMLTNIGEIKFIIINDVLSMEIKYANEKTKKEITLGTAKFE